MKKKSFFLFFFLSIFFLGCSSSSSTSSGGNQYINISFSGIVVDGYISGSSVCIDSNLNRICDSNEPVTSTSEAGTFSFSNVSVLENSFVHVISTGGVDTATGRNFIGELKTVLNASTINSSVYQNVTPLTDLISIGFLNASTRSDAVLNNSRNAISNAYTISDTYVDQNPMAYAGVYSRTQEIQQTVGLLEAAAIKAKGTSLTSLERRALREEIKLSLVQEIAETGTLNLVNAITKLEYIAGITLTANEKTFLDEELREIKLSLDALVQNTNLTSDNLNNYQIALENEADKIYATVATMDGTAPITVVPVDINIDEILAIVPDSNSSDTNTTDTNSSDSNITIPDSGTTSTTPETTTTKISFGGYIVDGYISEATICMDINYNGVCDSSEPSVLSTNNGSYVFQNIEVTKSSIIPLIGFSGTDTAVQKTRSSELKNIVDTSSLDILNITPITDFIVTDFMQQTTKDADTFKVSIDRVASGFELTSTSINADPMQDVTTFVLSQELEYMRRILEKVLGKTLDTELQNSIKKAILTQILEVGYKNVSIDRVITILEIDLEIFVSEESRQFAINQMLEISRFLNDMLASEEIQSYTLEILQSMLEESVVQAIETETYSDINLTAETVAYSEFSKTDAIYDPNSCDITNVYTNTLSDSNVSSGFTSDTQNGMIVQSDIEDVTLYYEDIPSSLSANYTTVFQDNYYFSFDQSWATSGKTIYIRLPKGTSNKYECYRTVLDSTLANQIELEKVFRYTLANEAIN